MTYRNRPLLDLARGQHCTARILGVCNHNPETVVSAHDNRWHGMSDKAPDFRVAWCCSACHDWIDGRSGGASNQDRHAAWDAAHRETVACMWLQGLVQVKGYTPREKRPTRSAKVLAHPGYSR